MLQGTHSDINSEDTWKKEFDGTIYFSRGSNSSRGVALLVPRKLNVNVIIESAEIDFEGRILAINAS